VTYPELTWNIVTDTSLTRTHIAYHVLTCPNLNYPVLT